MSDYCVLCWSEKRERVAAVADVGDELLCAMHAQIAGWREPEAPAVAPSSMCECGKTNHHIGRCRGIIRKSPKPDPSVPVVATLRAENKSIRAIAEETGIGRETVHRIVQKLEPPPVVAEPLPTTLSGFEKAIQADRVTITVTAVQLDAFWNRLSLPEKARIVEGLL